MARVVGEATEVGDRLAARLSCHLTAWAAPGDARDPREALSGVPPREELGQAPLGLAPDDRVDPGEALEHEGVHTGRPRAAQDQAHARPCGAQLAGDQEGGRQRRAHHREPDHLVLAATQEALARRLDELTRELTRRQAEREVLELDLDSPTLELTAEAQQAGRWHGVAEGVAVGGVREEDPHAPRVRFEALLATLSRCAILPCGGRCPSW